jgi:predicted nucleic acid-binding protein
MDDPHSLWTLTISTGNYQMLKVAVVNASPLIFLARSGHLGLLSKFYSTVLVPSVVMNELLARGEKDPTVIAVKSASWLTIDHTNCADEMVSAWGLGVGESGVISLAVQRADAEVIIDDMLGRRCASSMGLFVRGTLGIVLLAKKSGLISSAKVVLDDLIRVGMYLDQGTLKSALSKVGE